MDEFELELKQDFLEEAIQLIESIEQSFLQLEDSPEDGDLLNEIFRFAHNLKGTSRAVGFGEIAEFTHELESLILKLKEGEIKSNDNIISCLLRSNDHISMMIDELKTDFDKKFESQDLIKELQNFSAGNVSSTEVTPSTSDTVAVENTPKAEEFGDFEDIEEFENGVDSEPEAQVLSLEDLEKMAMENHQKMLTSESVPKQDEKTENKPVECTTEAESAPTLEILQGDKKLVSNEEIEKQKTNPKKASKKISEDETIRVNLSKIELLNNYVGELVILQTVLNQKKQELTADEFVMKSISQLGKISNEIQDISMSLRMVPIKSTLQKMSRIVRDTSKTLDKDVQLTLDGEETEIDKTVLEYISDPLVHIVRNAVDHGLESKDDRLISGKGIQGNIQIKACHEGNNLVIRIIDDGKGIDPEVIRRKAIEKGLIKESTNLPDKEIIQYIFHPGFSTKDIVSEVSGRGVGMDVVKTNLESISGTVSVDTKIGEGSVFTIHLPLTMAIIEGMVIQDSGTKLIVPLTALQESIRPNKENINEITGVGECLNLRGEIIPIFNVCDLLKIKNVTDNKKTHEKILMIINGKENRFAISIDDILHQQQVVVKSLGNEIKDKKGFMGSTILSDGMPTFILDFDDLIEFKKLDSINNMAA